MNELIPCPFCGSEDYYIAVTKNPFSYDIYSTAHCSKCNATGPFVAESYLEDEPKPTRDYMEAVAKEKWQTRPIEDTLNKRIAELVSSNMLMAKGVLDLKARIAELEAESERFTVHSDIERQDDKWIPVSERLPEEDKLVLFYDNSTEEIRKGWLSNNQWTSDEGIYYNCDRFNRITHWRLLPEQPEVTE